MLYFFASKIGVKLPPRIKVPWHWRGPGRSSASNYHFRQKNAFFGQKKAFFQKVYFIQNLSVTQNTVFHWVKNNFMLSHPKLVFVTRFYLLIWLLSQPKTCTLTIVYYLFWKPSNFAYMSVLGGGWSRAWSSTFRFVSDHNTTWFSFRKTVGSLKFSFCQV